MFPEIQGVHVGSNLRLINVTGSAVRGLRTFTGVRSDLSQDSVGMFMTGFNALSDKQATQATLTTRARLEPVG